MFGPIPVLTEGWKDSLVGTALGEGVMEEYIEKVWQKCLRQNFLDDTFGGVYHTQVRGLHYRLLQLEKQDGAELLVGEFRGG